MAKGNVIGDGNIRVVRADRAEQLDLYDSLPRRWRRLVDSLPVPQDVREVNQVLEKFGDEAGFDLIVGVYKMQYPGWSPDSL
jgi:hypothetical protein